MRPLRTRLEQARKDTGMAWAVLERDYLEPVRSAEYWPINQSRSWPQHQNRVLSITMYREWEFWVGFCCYWGRSFSTSRCGGYVWGDTSCAVSLTGTAKQLVPELVCPVQPSTGPTPKYYARRHSAQDADRDVQSPSEA
jgi:hypothetical protein